MQVLRLVESENLVTGLQRLHFREGPPLLAAIVARFDEAGLLRDVYSYLSSE